MSQNKKVQELKKIQQAFIQFIYQSKDLKDLKVLNKEITSPVLQKEACLSVYQQNVIATLQKNLNQIYPAIKQIVGKLYFDYLTRQYIALFPAKDVVLESYGKYFSAFLLKQKSISVYPFLADLGVLEWCIHRIMVAFPASKAVNPTEIQNLLENLGQQSHTLKLQTNPAGILFTSKYPIDDIWETVLLNRKKIKAIKCESQRKQATYLYLRHKNGQFSITRLNQLQFACLKALQKPLTVVQCLQQTRSAFKATINLFPVWITQGYLIVKKP